MLAVSMPNFATSAALVETATKCFATAFSSRSDGQAPRARRLRVGHRLQRGEGLRGDDEQRLRRVEVARRLGEVGAVDVGDEAEGQVALRCSGAAPRRPSPGPRSEPPMPMLITLRMRLPVWPVHAPLRTRSANAAMRSSTSCTAGTTSSPSTTMRAPRGARSATCRTARSFGDVDLLARGTSRRCARAGRTRRPARAAAGGSRP